MMALVDKRFVKLNHGYYYNGDIFYLELRIKSVLLLNDFLDI